MTVTALGGSAFGQQPAYANISISTGISLGKTQAYIPVVLKTGINYTAPSSGGGGSGRPATGFQWPRRK